MEDKVKKPRSAYRKLEIVILVLSVLAAGGCSNLSGFNKARQEKADERGSGENVSEKDISDNKEFENDFTADISDKSEIREYILPETIWKITGMTAEEQAVSFRDSNPGNYYFTDIVVNKDNALVLTMTEKQKNMYMEEVILYLNNNIKEAYEKEDIQIKSNENYREVKMILGEESDSAGFQGTFVKVISYMAVYQILNGCEPEEWGIHLIVEREEEIILDADIPDDKWVLTNEDFEE